MITDEMIMPELEKFDIMDTYLFIRELRQTMIGILLKKHYSLHGISIAVDMPESSVRSIADRYYYMYLDSKEEAK